MGKGFKYFYEGYDMQLEEDLRRIHELVAMKKTVEAMEEGLDRYAVAAPITEVNKEVAADFKNRYGKDWKSVYYATANKQDRDPETFEKTEEGEKPGLWDNIRKKRARGESPAKPGDKDYPDEDAWKKAQEAEYQGKDVKLNKPSRNTDGKKKFKVYVDPDGDGKAKKVSFGDPNMEIKRDDPERRKSFRARHNCDNPGPKDKARYWSCYQWRKGAKVADSEKKSK